MRGEERGVALFYQLLESKLYFNSQFNLKWASKLCGISEELLEGRLLNEVGLSFREIVNGYRVLEGRELLKKGVDFDNLYRVLGFSSKREFIEAVDSIVN